METIIQPQGGCVIPSSMERRRNGVEVKSRAVDSELMREPALLNS
jgi:hypothetical protein